MAKTICAWCGDILEEGSGPVSHGICPSCAVSLLSEQRCNLARYFDLFDEPIALVDEEAAVLAASRSLGHLVGRDPRELERLKPGEIFDCACVAETGDCGSGPSCDGCGLRRSVRSTFDSGGPVVDAAASVRQRLGGELRFEVSTEKFAGAVLLRFQGPAAAPQGKPRR